MDTRTLLCTVICLFALAAGGGLVMVGIRLLADRNPPAWLAMGHGLLAAAGLTLLTYGFFVATLPPLAVWALILLLLAAAGGAVLNLAYQWKNIPLPKPMMFGHAGLAVAGFVLLVLAWIG